MATLATRVATGGPDDLPAVMTVMGEAFDPVFGEAWTEAQCAGMLHLPGSWLSIASDGDGTGGFALSRDVMGEVELLLIAVRPAARGRGIGRAIVDAVVREGAARGATLVHLEVRDGNPAIRLYEAAGFTEIGRRRDYYRGADGGLHDARTFRRAVRLPDAAPVG